MLTIITNATAIPGIDYAWNGLQLGMGIHLESLLLNPTLAMSISAEDFAVCAAVHPIQYPINFRQAGEKMLLSPKKVGAWRGVIALEFSQAVQGAGAQIGIVGLGSPRKFKALVRAYDTAGKEYSVACVTTSTNNIDGSALFVGALSNGQGAKLKRIEFDAEPIIGGNGFKKFAIGTLVYQV